MNCVIQEWQRVSLRKKNGINMGQTRKNIQAYYSMYSAHVPRRSHVSINNSQMAIAAAATTTEKITSMVHCSRARFIQMFFYFFVHGALYSTRAKQ